jgi:hypothetical protein
MSDFNIRADAVDVEQIMRQIRARIRDKRGVDYTEEQIQELAKVRLEKFLDPKGVRSDLLEQFRRRAETELPPNYEFDDTTLFDSDKPMVAFFRRLLRPFLKLLFSPNKLGTALHLQSRINRHLLAHDALFYEVVHNLVVEMTRTSIDVKTIQMRVESISGRLDFNERRARALEAVVQYRPDAMSERGLGGSAPTAGASEGTPPSGVDPITGGESLRSRRRRRRRGRRSGPGFAENHEEGRRTRDEGRAVSDERRATSDERGPASDERRTTSDERRAANDEQAASDERRVERHAPGVEPSPASPASESASVEPRADIPEPPQRVVEPSAATATPQPASVEPPSDSGSNAS